MFFRLCAATVLGLTCFLVPVAQAGPRDALQTQLAHALRARHVKPAQTGAVVLDLQTGRTLFAEHARLALRPASNEK
ncbi:MAG TPA: hypothetical protein VJ716_00450, partial [Gaiellaceae bacterium]|nr:hypothetical protein [Gaiellaceae bacterium]